MEATLDLPQDPDAIDAEWLGRALSERFPGTQVSSVEVTALRHGTNSHADVEVHYAAPCELPTRFFLKLPPTDPARREAINRTGMGRREALFYQRLAERVSMRVPRPFVSLFDEASGAFVLLIEDLQRPEIRFPDCEEGVNFEQALGAMRDFAALHVRYEDPAIRALEAGWVERMPGGSDFGTSMLQIGLDHHRERLRDDFAEIAALYIARQSAFEELWDRGRVSALQGDSHIGNLFVENGRVGFLDWGLIQLGHPMRDVSYFISMALNPERRRRHEHALIEHYLEARSDFGGDPIAFDEAWQLHRIHASYLVPAACPLVLFPEDQSAESERSANAFLERAYCAVEDLEVRAVLRDEAGI